MRSCVRKVQETLRSVSSCKLGGRHWTVFGGQRDQQQSLYTAWVGLPNALHLKKQDVLVVLLCWCQICHRLVSNCNICYFIRGIINSCDNLVGIEPWSSSKPVVILPPLLIKLWVLPVRQADHLCPLRENF